MYITFKNFGGQGQCFTGLCSDPTLTSLSVLQIIACAIVIGILVHAGTHLACDFPRIINSTPEDFALIASPFNGVKPTFKDLMTGAEGITGMSMVILTTIAFTLASTHFRRNRVSLPAPLDRLTGFNAFWYTHHLLVVVYIMLIVHGTLLFFADKWYQKTVRITFTLKLKWSKCLET